MKEDPEQQSPPEAPEAPSMPSTLPQTWQQAMPSQTRSSEVTEIADSYEELKNCYLVEPQEVGNTINTQFFLPVFSRFSWEFSMMN